MELLVDVVVIAGVGVVAPLALGNPVRWLVAAVGVAAALAVGTGAAAATLTLPALAVAIRSVLDHLGDVGVRGAASLPLLVRSLDTAVAVVVPAWAVVAMASLLASVGGIELFGIGEPIVRLTAVHYLYAGVGALTLARRVRRERTDRSRVAVVAVLATAGAPPIVAMGFVLEHPIPQIGGAALMTVGVWATAAVLLASALRAPTTHRGLRTVAGLTPWAPMVLAVAWATAQHVSDVPALSVPDMARVHGLANGIGFVFVGLVATRPGDPGTPARRPVEVTA